MNNQPQRVAAHHNSPSLRLIYTVACGIVLLFTTTLFTSIQARAGNGSFVSFKPGFAGPTGLPIPGIGVYESSPLLADLKHDGTMEIIIGSGRDPSGGYNGNSRLTAVNPDGTILWSVKPRPASEITTGKIQPPIESSPALIKDIDGDGWDDIVVGLGGLAYNVMNWDGGMAAYSGRTGQRLWVYNSDDWMTHKIRGYKDGVFSTPAVGDVFGNGNQEIAFASWDNCIYLLDKLGHPLWTNTGPYFDQGHCNNNQGYYNEDTIWSSPALADLNGDGKLEVIIGTDVSTGNFFGDPAGGYLLVLNSAGYVIARKWLDQAIYSSPAVGDIDNDGKLEIVTGSGYPYTGKGRYVKAFSYVYNADPKLSLVQKWSVTTAGAVFSSPAIADLNGDGIKDVIAMSLVGDLTTCSNSSGQAGNMVYAISGKTGVVLWSKSLIDVSGTKLCESASPVIADIDGDGKPEILISISSEVGILRNNGTQYTAASLTDNTRPTFYGYCTISDTPSVGDFDRDGNMEIVAGSSDCAAAPNNAGSLKVWAIPAAGSTLPWPMFRRSASRTGSALLSYKTFLAKVLK